jgi:protein SCO1/2
MRLHEFVAIGFALVAAAGCGGRSGSREYRLQGQVLSVTADHTEANIKHEDIKGLMPGMTMPYKVRDPGQFADLKRGDLITSTLVVVSNDAYLKDVKRVGEAPLEKTPGEASSASSGFELLKPGEAVPTVPFLDQDGKPRDFASFKDSIVVVTFMYTRCPMPTFCPLMDQHFATIQGKLKTDPSLTHVHLVSVSFDPLTDTPAVLKNHATALGADPDYWTFLTGDRDAIDQFAMRFGVAVSREMNDPLTITHTLRTAIIDAKGNFVKAYAGNEWTPEQVLADLRHVEK